MTGAGEVVAEARRWIGTPFHHQASVLGVGVDCYGLIRGVAGALGLCPDHHLVKNYSRIPDGRMTALLERDLLQVPLAARRPGDVLNFWWVDQPQHLGILSDRNTVIHAYGNDGHGHVVETSLAGWHVRRLRRVYRFPGVV